MFFDLLVRAFRNIVNTISQKNKYLTYVYQTYISDTLLDRDDRIRVAQKLGIIFVQLNFIRD